MRGEATDRVVPGSPLRLAWINLGQHGSWRPGEPGWILSMPTGECVATSGVCAKMLD